MAEEGDTRRTQRKRTYYAMRTHQRCDYTGRWFSQIETRTREDSLYNGDWLAEGEVHTVRATSAREAQSLAERLILNHEQIEYGEDA